MPYAVVIDDDRAFQDAMGEFVKQAGFTVEAAETLAAARTLLSRRIPDLVFLDLALPDGDGTELADDLAQSPSTDVVFITGHATVKSAIDAFRQGVVDYLTKPIDFQRLRTILANVARRRELFEEVQALRAELRGLGRFGPLIGASPTMQHAYDAIGRVAATNATVLIEGESGTGKELVAQAVHGLSRRRREPFVAVNCGAVSANLIESELFGHERGSFTGAERAHKGFFERANGGTLFLDEITEMPLELQIKLLRALETRHITRIGGERDIPLDVRVIAATNVDPEQAVQDGKLREDLLYRLRVFPIRLPPLRERMGDVDLLVQHFLSQLNRDEGTDKQITRAALDALRACRWPGNVRELCHAVHTAFLLADDEVGTAHLPPSVHHRSDSRDGPVAPGALLEVRIGTSIADVERRLILATLAACDGKKEKAVLVLGISLKTLYNRLNEYRERTPSGEPATV